MICKDYQNQNLMKKLVLQKKLMLSTTTHKSLFIESNPAPVKYAASLLGLCKKIPFTIELNKAQLG